MAKTTAPPTSRRRAAAAPAAAPELETEFASRLTDPFEQTYLGIIRTNDPLLLERGDQAWRLYLDLIRDGAVFKGMQKRVHALISRPWQVEPVEQSAKGTADAEQVTAILKRLKFDQVCRRLMLALLCGWSVGEVIWTVRDGYVAPGRIAARALRRFVFVQDEGDDQPQLRLLTREAMLKGVPVPDRKFIVHRVNDLDDNPYGTGLGLQLFWAVYFKRLGLVGWNRHLDKFGSPTIWGRYPRNAGPKEKASLFDGLKRFRSDGVVTTPEGSLVELLKAADGNGATHQQLCEYLDDWIGSVLTGQEPRAGGGGALAAASKERMDVSLDITQADSDLLSDTLNDGLIAWICDINGFEPCHVYRQIKEEEDLKAAAETDKTVSEMGFELSVDAVRAKYGEGWEKKATPPPAPAPVSGAPLAAAAQAANDPAAQPAVRAAFAEPPAASPIADPVAALLAKAMDSQVGAWAQQIGNLVQQYSEPARLQDALLASFGDLPSKQLAQVMELALVLADLQGRDRVRQEAGLGNGA
ncbi:DUF935 family protein [uncultured Pseudacidovorax sp.]|uniref:DUF935 domain-containing protein n=1 Tax=uncultured Pseudacidovorax sp. TaxID=679313 RepID=UPI0025EB86D1|nr:DUF935 family protein [uncultured Pseudacidovorax sp.]